MNVRTFLLIAGLLGLLSACSKGDDAIKPPESAENLYNEALTDYGARKYKEAVKSFDEVERQHPASEWATNAQIMSAYSSYQAEDYTTAISAFERFTKLYPGNSATPYAYYMIALCYYEQISDVGRDQKITEQAMAALRELIRRFPDTEYARDARIKLDLTQDHLAGKEMEIGRYYLRHNDYLAAINRFRFVVENYQTTSHVPEALHRLVEAYLRLGVKDEATRYAAVLGNNFPGSPWYRDSYKDMVKAARLKDNHQVITAATAPAAPVTPVSAAPVTPPSTEPPIDKIVAEKPVAEKPVAAQETSFWDHFIPFDNAVAAPSAQKPVAEKTVDEKPVAAQETSFWDHLIPW